MNIHRPPKGKFCDEQGTILKPATVQDYMDKKAIFPPLNLLNSECSSSASILWFHIQFYRDRCEVLMKMTMKSSVFWNVKLWALLRT
jgi:hypothetical protein